MSDLSLTWLQNDPGVLLPRPWLSVNAIAMIPIQLGMIGLVATLGLILSALMYLKAYRMGRVPILIQPQGRSQKPIDAFWYPYKGTPKYHRAYQQIYWGSFCLVSALMLVIASISPTAYVGLTVMVMIGCLLTFISFILLSTDLAEVILWCTSLLALPLIFILVQSMTGPSGLATLAAFLSSGLIGLPFSAAIMKRLRSHPSFWCASCKQPMKRLPPQELSAYLTGSEKLAQQQNRVIFEALECPDCSDPTHHEGIHIRAYIKPSPASVPLLPPARSPVTWKLALEVLDRLKSIIQQWLRSQLTAQSSTTIKRQEISTPPKIRY